MDSDALKTRIFYRGVEHKFRKEVWEIYWDLICTIQHMQRGIMLFQLKHQSTYMTIKNQCQSICPEEAKRFTKIRERNGDDNPNISLLHGLGYCQGMNDLFSLILLFIMKDES